MKTILILTVALLPAIALLYYIWKKDPQKEPTSWLVKAVVWGVAICIPIAGIDVGMEAEEAGKLLVLWLLLRKNPYFDEHFDGIVYAVCVGLGFAAIENVFYVFDHSDEWLSVAVMRSLLAVPGHYAYAVLMGYYYSIYHFVDRSPRTAVCIFAVPVIAHGIYDAIAMSGMVNEYVGGLSSFVLIYFCVKMHKFALKKIVAQIERDRNSYS